jgi:hypothetical protein
MVTVIYTIWDNILMINNNQSTEILKKDIYQWEIIALLLIILSLGAVSMKLLQAGLIDLRRLLIKKYNKA